MYGVMLSKHHMGLRSRLAFPQWLFKVTLLLLQLYCQHTFSLYQSYIMQRLWLCFIIFFKKKRTVCNNQNIILLKKKRLLPSLKPGGCIN